MTLWLTHFHAVDQAQDLLAATAIGNQMMGAEAARGYPVTNDSGDFTVWRSIDNATTPYTYHWDCTVGLLPGADPTVIGVKTVNITVTWFGDFHIQKSISMVTYVYWGG